MCPREQLERGKVNRSCREDRSIVIFVRNYYISGSQKWTVYTLSVGVSKQSGQLENTGNSKEEAWVRGPVPKWVTEKAP